VTDAPSTHGPGRAGGGRRFGSVGAMPEPSVPPTVPPAPDPDEVLALATKVAQGAADLLVEAASRPRASVTTKSSATDMVTEMDRAAEQYIVGELLAARPGDGIVAEEGSARPSTSGLRWVIDPLDGTTNYLYDHPGWSVSIAAEIVGADGRNELLVGVVVDPVHHETFSAVLGRGATRNGEPIHCADQGTLAQALVATGFGYQPERRRAQAELLVQLLPTIRDIRRMGSAAIDLCWVACGRVDAYFEYGLNWWDWAAGSLIATEAGALLAPMENGPDDGTRSLVAAGPALMTPLRAALGALGAHRVP
jgi:myo-inositol-1(or 4)-monophosphatase